MLLPLKILAPFPALVPRCRSFAAATIFSLSSLSLSPPSPMEDTSAPSPIASAAADGGVDAEFGFSRPEMGKVDLAGTVGLYERHVFLCHKSADEWPPNLEAEGLDSLPRLLSAGLAARKSDMKKRTRLTICEGEDGTESSNGDVLIFPDMIRYRQLTHSDVDNFVEEVLVKDTEWLPGAVETMTGSHVFVCAHGSRDRRCGVCGPVLIEKFKEEINSRSLQGQVFVSPCSHIGGHKYAGNVIIFSPNTSGKVSGHWYGYVTPTDVPKLLEQHIGKGEIIEHLWRGEMGLSAEDQKELHALRSKTLQATETNGFTNSTINGGGGCCQGVGNSSCCQNTVVKEKGDEPEITEKDKANEPEFSEDNKGVRARKLCGMPTWFESWERENTYVTLAVVAAAASVAVAYSCYKQMK